MKTAGIITSEYGREKGGIQNWIYYIRQLLSEQGYETMVYTYREDRMVRKLPKLYRADLFVLATWKMSLFVLPLLYITQKPLFILVHGNEILHLNRLQKIWLKYLLSRPRTCFVANSQAIASLFTSQFGRRVDLVQSPFMDIPEDVPSVKKQSVPIFLTVTRLVKRKNIYRVLKALAQLKDEGILFRYIIAGTGEEKEGLERLTLSLGLEKEVTFLGMVSEEEKAQLYRKSSYFLLPSLYDKEDGSIEGYGIVFIEANAYGLPVLSGNTGGMVEAVVDGVTGLHSDGSVEDILWKIKRMLQTEFNTREIYAHAKKHHYRKQHDFLSLLEKGCRHEV